MNFLYKLVSIWDSLSAHNDPPQSSTIEAFATQVTASDTLLALAVSTNELVFIRIAQNQEVEKVTKPWPYDDPMKKIFCMTFSGCGRWLICVLASGSLEVFPTRLALVRRLVHSQTCDYNVSGAEIEYKKVQQPTLFSDSELTSIQCCCRDDCLALPTCAIWYETKKKRPMLVYSNKGGDILFVDLMIRRLSVSLQAPQSIHNLDVVDDFVQNDRFLLVTGFAGSQWLVPLEQNSRSLRETLGRIVPSELRELNVRGCVSSVYSMGTKCIGLLQKDHFLLFNGINFVNPVIDIVLPENTWTVSYTDIVMFIVCNQNQVAFVINQCCSTDQNLTTAAKFSSVFGVLPTGRFLGFSLVPNVPEKSLPTCLLVTESGVFCAKPETTPTKMMLHHFFTPTPDLPNAELLCKAFDLDFKTCCFESVPLLLEEENLDCALQLCYLAKTDFLQIAEMFVKKGFSKFILPKVEGWILRQSGLNESTKSDLSKIAFNLHLNMIKNSSDFECKRAEHEFKEFLSHNLWYEPEECLQILLKQQLYVVALELVKVHNLQEIFLKELLTVDVWPITDDFLSLITCSSNTTFLLDHRSTLCLHFISRVTKIFDQFPNVWMAKVLYLFDPVRPEIRRFVEQAKDQTFSVGVENLILEVVRFYLSTLIKYLFKYNKQHLNISPTSKGIITSIDSTSMSNNTSMGQNDLPLACGADHCCVVAVDGMYCWGRNKNGCLGNGNVSIERYSTPIRVQISFDYRQILQVACGAEHTMCLCKDGSVYEWGSNRYGQLASGDTINRSSPHLVSTFANSSTNVIRIVSGQYHCAAIDVNGLAFTWGWNVHGQLGQKVIEDILVPKLLEIFSKNSNSIADVACGYAHTVFLTQTGVVYVCGNSTYGQVGLGDTKKRSVPVLLKFSEYTERVTMIACGFFHNLALTNKRRLWIWGATPQSLKFKALLQKRKQQIQQLVQENESTKPLPLTVNEGMAAVEGRHLKPSEIEIGHLNCNEIKRFCCGYHHNCLLMTSGQLYTWGKGLEFQLGHGDKKERLVPSPVTTISDKTVSFVSCGADFTITVDSNGLMNGWGKNDFSQLGFESVTETEKRKLSGKVLTIQRANKSERTIQLPQDGRIYVAKPTRIVGLRVSTKRTDIKDDLAYDRMSLFAALLEFDGFYKLEELEDLCRNYSAFEINSFLHLVRGDYINSVIFLLDSMVNRDQVDLKDIVNVLEVFTSVCLRHELNTDQRSEILAALLKRIVKIQPSFDFDSYFEEHFNDWALVIANLITKDGAENWPFSLNLKMKAIKHCGKLVRKSNDKETLEVQQKRLIDVGSVITKEHYRNVSSFQCGHLIAEYDNDKELTSNVIDGDEFKTKFPRTIDCLMNVISKNERNFTVCPTCLTTNMLKFTSPGTDVLSLL